MTFDYSLLGQFPLDDPEVAVIDRVAAVLGSPVMRSPDGSPRINWDGLLVYAVEPDDEDRSLTRESFGFENNLTLVFVDLSHGDGDMVVRASQNELKVVYDLAALPGFRAVLIADYSDEAFLASIQDGQVTLNKDYWEPWEAAPEVLAFIPQPHRMESLHLLPGSNT
jgi:hypothetical protein